MYATIDVGTNTVRLLLGEVKHGQVIPYRYERAITRLGGNSCPRNGLAPEAMERTLSILDAFTDQIRSSKCTIIRAVATEAVRRATNGADFIALVHERCGLELKIIPGHDEAQLSASGVLSVVRPLPDYSLIIDIGGGSTELIFCRNKEIVATHSYPVGAVGLHELENPLAARQRLDEFAAKISADFAQLESFDQTVLIGTAGTITTVAAALLKMTEYDWRRINNYRFTLAELDAFYCELLPLSVAEREELSGVEQGRGDILPAGIEILQTIFNTFTKDVMTVSDFGLLEGLLLSLNGANSPTRED